MDIMQFMNNATNFLTPYWQGFLAVLPFIKIISGVVSFLLFILAVWLVVKTQIIAVRLSEFSELMRQAPAPRKKALKEWALILERMRRGSESDLKLAVIEADKLFDDTLKRMGFTGETMADRLKKITLAQLSGIDGVWSAHKLRNLIVHGSDFRLLKTEADEAVAFYEKALREWGMID